MQNLIITGAGGALGWVVTSHFLSRGYRVIAVVRDEKGKQNLPVHPNIQAEALDLSDEKASGQFFNNMAGQHQHIDGLLLLAGGFAGGNITSTTSSDIRAQIALNFETAFHLAKPAFNHMLENDRGRIVFISSRPALLPSAGKDMIAYGLSKSLLLRLAEYLNASAKGKNVSAHVIVPSTLDTEANRKSMPGAAFENWVKTEDLASILEFLFTVPAVAIKEAVLKVYNKA